MEILKIIDRSKVMSAVLVPTIEIEDKHWIQVSFSFFFHAKSATTSNHWTELSDISC